MKTLKEYIVESEWWGSSKSLYDFDKHHNVDNLEGKELENAAKQEFEKIKLFASDFKQYRKQTSGTSSIMLNVPAIIKYIGLKDKLKTNVQVINIDVCCRNSFPKYSKYLITAGSYKSMTASGVDIGSMDLYQLEEKENLDCKSAVAIVKTHIKPIVSDFNDFCKWLKDALKNGKYWNRATGEGMN